MNKKIIIVTGDPNSINSELIYKSWKKLNVKYKKNIFFISNYHLLKKQFLKLKYKIKVIKVNDFDVSDCIKVFNVDLNFTDSFKVKRKPASRFVINSLNLAHQMSLKKNTMGFINCPINKRLLNVNEIGVTEFLSSKCGIKDNSEVMLLKSNKLYVSPISTHVDMKNIFKKINTSTIVNKAKTIDKWFRKNLKKKPKIGVIGLNPHNAELRANSEEKKIIIPSIIKLNKLGINAKGPLVADTLFINDYKKFDVIIGMYHDQVLTPFKTLFKFNAINITLGLKYLRVSPDHGVAYDLIGKNKGDPSSLIQCIKFLNKYKK
jgi:4-hydroxy-L-threonine phosphate dehydrogenase PdxA